MHDHVHRWWQQRKGYMLAVTKICIDELQSTWLWKQALQLLNCPYIAPWQVILCISRFRGNDFRNSYFWILGWRTIHPYWGPTHHQTVVGTTKTTDSKLLHVAETLETYRKGATHHETVVGTTKTRNSKSPHVAETLQTYRKDKHDTQKTLSWKMPDQKNLHSET